QQTTRFCVQGDSAGCMAETCNIVEFIKNCTIEVPNIIKSNNTGFNSNWCSLKKDCFTNQELFVYDRWGNLLYTTSGEEVCWSPTSLDANFQNQVFTFLLKTTNEDSATKYYSGTITLVK
ncbi:MAG TPA: gliding motility-associated C-terminal domain-containing protein, partial [Saprospiraceae bacterium]|nr:gliding motility-associated C-terminal domain-containing protein [Saprospiraceae bacterium]